MPKKKAALQSFVKKSVAIPAAIDTLIRAEFARQIRQTEGGDSHTLPTYSGALAELIYVGARDILRCRVCGCTDFAACEGGCSWIEADEGDDAIGSHGLCSACEGK